MYLLSEMAEREAAEALEKARSDPVILALAEAIARERIEALIQLLREEEPETLELVFLRIVYPEKAVHRHGSRLGFAKSTAYAKLKRFVVKHPAWKHALRMRAEIKEAS